MDILVVEDDPTVQQVITKTLERGGFMVKCVGNGLQAMAEIEEASFKAIVCDVGLPFLEGKSLFDHIKEGYPQMAERVIFVTGMANDPETRKFLDATGRPVIAKPFELRDLVRVVRSVVEHTTKPSKPPQKPED